MLPAKDTFQASNWTRHWLVRYGLAVLLAVAAAAVPKPMRGSSADNLTYLTFYPAVIVAALVGGTGPGILATFVSAALADYFLVVPVGSLAIRFAADAWGLLVFSIMGVCISKLAGVTRQANEELRQVLEAAPEAILEVAPDGGISLVNKTAERMFGYSRKEFLALNVDDLVPRDRRRNHVRHRLAYTQQPKRRPMASGLELAAQRKDGSLFPVEISLSPNHSGRALKTIASLRDITDRKRAEDAVKTSEQRLNLALESAHMGIWELDPASDTAFRNLQHDRIFGYDSLQPEWGARIFLARHALPEDRDWLRKQFENASVTGTLYFECRILWPDQSLHWIQAQGRAIRDGSGRFTTMMGTVQDITARKTMEAQLETDRAQLASSARMASLGMMAGGVAHEINNPLAIIHASAANLLRQAKGEGAVPVEHVVRAAERIHQTANRIAKIVRSLRYLARDGSHDAISSAAVAGILDEALEVCRERFTENSVQLILPHVDPALSVSVREVQIAQVVLNLLQNAYDAVVSQEGDKWIRLDVAVEDGSVLFSVTDSGPGIPPGIRSQIMEPFFTTKEVGKGTGLGLSLSRATVEEHGGKLELTENQGHTCFSFWLPIAAPTEKLCNSEMHQFSL